MAPGARAAVARKAAVSRWVRARFGDASFESLGLPGGEVLDRGISDLCRGRRTVAGYLVSLAAPRLRREGIPVGPGFPDPEEKLWALLVDTEGDLAHTRYSAYLRLVVSFADACRLVRRDKT